MTDGKNPTVLLTRSADDNSNILPIFESAGLSTVNLPGIVISEPNDWSATDEAITALSSYDGVFFTSRKAVGAFLSRLDTLRIDGRTVLRELRIAAVGQKTEEALLAEDIHTDIVPEIGSAENLLASLDELELNGRRFLFPKSSIARDVLPTELRHRGADIDEIIVYKTTPPNAGSLDGIRERLLGGSITCIAFFSPSAVRNIMQMLGSRCLQDPVLAAIGPTTAASIEAVGLSVDLLSPKPDTHVFARSIAEHLRNT